MRVDGEIRRLTDSMWFPTDKAVLRYRPSQGAGKQHRIQSVSLPRVVIEMDRIRNECRGWFLAGFFVVRISQQTGCAPVGVLIESDEFIVDNRRAVSQVSAWASCNSCSSAGLTVGGIARPISSLTLQLTSSGRARAESRHSLSLSVHIFGKERVLRADTASTSGG